MIKKTWINFKKYSFLLKQLVSRDFKVKYKRSVLGMLWSVLYPVLMTMVMAVVFENMFKFKVEGRSYIVYLMSGLVMFNYFSEATNLSMSSVVGNFSLLNKVYIPKYIFPLSKCLVVGINFLLTLIPLYAIIVIEMLRFPEYNMVVGLAHLALPFSFLCLFLFSLGVGLILSTVSVFLRDMFYIYGIVLTILNYMTPIMYDISFIQNPVLLAIMKCNPLYQYINFSRCIIIEGRIPELIYFFYCGASAVLVLLFGIVIFKKNQDKFIYYV
ncbi:MAG: ABC transporter permease [Ruminococcaceae bacterium]|nr:ABC transporter permease [Oscillospiraceae bacterium]